MQNSTKNNNHEKYLTFLLSDEEYGIVISKVVEIISSIPSVPLPQTPAYILGVINLRKNVIPVVDLRIKLGMEPNEMKSAVIVIVHTGGVNLGLLVDSVCEVVDIHEDAIDSTTALGDSINIEFINGIAKTEKSIKILLDIDKVLSTQDVMHFHKITENETMAA